MLHRGLLDITLKDEKFCQVERGVGLKVSPQAVFGITGAQKALWFAALLAKNPGRPLLAVTEDLAAAREQAADLAAFLGEEQVAVLPPQELFSLDVVAASPQSRAERISALTGFASGKIACIFVPVEAFSQKLPPPEVLASGIKKLQVGDTLDWPGLLSFMQASGYRREELVEAPGQFSVRGGILDFYPLTADNPWRLEFFDDEIDSIRAFDPETQRSLANRQFVEITPARELVLTPEAYAHALTGLENEMTALERSWQGEEGRLGALEKIREIAARFRVSLQEKIWEESWERITPLFYPGQVSLLNYPPVRPLVILDEPGRLKEFLQRKEQENAEVLTDFLAAGAALPVQLKAYMTYLEAEREWLQTEVIILALLPKVPPALEPKGLVTVAAKTMHAFFGKEKLLADELRQWRKDHYAVALMVNEASAQKRLKEMLWDEGLEAIITKEVGAPFLPGQLRIAEGSVSRGFQWPEAKLVLIGEQEIFARRTKIKPRKNFRQGRRIAGFGDLKPGDYVVHLHHGIGRYVGIEQLQVEGTHKDYLMVEYGGADKLYVPTDQLDLLQKYVGAEEGHPRLNKLGGSEWKKIKSRVKSAIEDLAEDLLELYAAREMIPGHAFAADTPWQQEFEASFPYTETADQLQAIAEVKEDLEKPRPMDRLLCGDVGYGKTEVALRAAFKAVMDSKQVAVLVPTTVLAQQHYRTFEERFAQYPVKIQVLSRFQTPKQQKQAVKDLAEGNIDVIIGTHRLLSKDVRFKNLGLVVVDEEQRFGVSHKEKLKVLCRNVDVLTLTATPIPRTLHMSLVGVRDMSVIETPPEERYPVQTYVVEYSPMMVREAVRRELARGGQVYFVHNRIAELPVIAGHLKQLVPEARIAVAHGQMSENILERVMLDFIEGEYDILLCTTIVENGLDISNVNTLIVYDADRLGLSQLYQLRGRVGRSNRLAYGYFTYRQDKTLTSIAEKRLAAIKEFTEFGSGFKIAMRDLELRGAGNLLGAEQHGHMMAVGFDLYCRMLQDAVNRLKHTRKDNKEQQLEETVEDEQENLEINLDFKIDAYFADIYLPNQQLKMEMYQRLAQAGSLEEIAELKEELVDRFGDPPEEVENLLLLAELKLEAKEALLTEVKQQGTRVFCSFKAGHPLKGPQLMQLSRKFPRRLSFAVSQGLNMEIKTIGSRERELLLLLLEIIREIKQLMLARQSGVQQ